MGQYCNLQLRAYVYEYRRNESGDGDPTYWYQMNGIIASLASGNCDGVTSWSYPLHKANSTEKTCPTSGVAYTSWRKWTIHRTS